MTNSDFTNQCDQIRRHRAAESCGWCFRSFLSCQNPLNCHMGQNIVLVGCSRFTGAVLKRKVSHHPMILVMQLETGHLLVNLGFGFPDFRLSKFSFCKTILENMLLNKKPVFVKKTIFQFLHVFACFLAYWTPV